MDKNLLNLGIENGLSQRKLAAEFGVSQSTIKHWLGRYGLKTKTQAKRVPGRKKELHTCRTHGLTMFVLEGRGSYRCMACRSSRITQERRRLKQAAVESKGGACSICGYNKCLRSLEFHHVDASTKEHEIGDLIMRRKKEALTKELEKCILVCSNCHGEIEDGLVAQLVVAIG